MVGDVHVVQVNKSKDASCRPPLKYDPLIGILIILIADPMPLHQICKRNRLILYSTEMLRSMATQQYKSYGDSPKMLYQLTIMRLIFQPQITHYITGKISANH